MQAGQLGAQMLVQIRFFMRGYMKTLLGTRTRSWRLRSMPMLMKTRDTPFSQKGWLSIKIHVLTWIRKSPQLKERTDCTIDGMKGIKSLLANVKNSSIKNWVTLKIFAYKKRSNSKTIKPSLLQLLIPINFMKTLHPKSLECGSLSRRYLKKMVTVLLHRLLRLETITIRFKSINQKKAIKTKSLTQWNLLTKEMMSLWFANNRILLQLNETSHQSSNPKSTKSNHPKKRQVIPD